MGTTEMVQGKFCRENQPKVQRLANLTSISGGEREGEYAEKMGTTNFESVSMKNSVPWLQDDQTVDFQSPKEPCQKDGGPVYKGMQQDDKGGMASY